MAFSNRYEKYIKIIRGKVYFFVHYNIYYRYKKNHFLNKNHKGEKNYAITKRKNNKQRFSRMGGLAAAASKEKMTS